MIQIKATRAIGWQPFPGMVRTEEAGVARQAILLPGAAVIAATDFGPVICGQLGIVTGRMPGRRLPWRRAAYACTFLGGISVAATRRQIIPHDHGHSRGMLEDPLWFLHTRGAVMRSNRSIAADLRRPEG